MLRYQYYCDKMRREIIVPDAVSKYKEYTLEIYIDEDPIETSRDFDNLGKIISWHRVYDFTDKAVKEEFDSSILESPNNFIEYATKNKLFYKPLFMYDHSGLSFSLRNDIYPFNDRWDAGQIGFIFATREDIKKWFNVDKINDEILDKAYKEFEMEVEELNKDEQGDNSYFILKKGNEQLESVSGFRHEDFSKNGFWEDLAKNNNISKNDIEGLRKNLKWEE